MNNDCNYEDYSLSCKTMTFFIVIPESDWASGHIFPEAERRKIPPTVRWIFNKWDRNLRYNNLITQHGTRCQSCYTCSVGHVGIELSQVESYHGPASWHASINGMRATNRFRSNQPNHLTGAYRSGSASWHAFIPFTHSILMMAKDVCNASRRFLCPLTLQRISLNWQNNHLNGMIFFFFSALFAFCYLPFSIPSICNWRFVAPKELSFVMVIQSTRPVLLVWQINVRLHDNIQRTKSMPKTRWKRSYFVCGMVASSSWLHAAMVVVCTLYTSCGGKYLSSRRRKVVSINYWALIYFCVSHTMPRARCPSD